MTPGGLRFGVVGTGTWAGLVHLPAASTSPRVRFTAILGRDAARAAAAAEGTTARPYTDLAGFLDAVDIVGFAVPPAVQAELASAAIAAGKHLLLEKPVSLDADVARRLSDEAEERGIRSIVFFTQRLVPELAAWAESTRELGGWAFGRVESWSSVLVDRSSPFHNSPWRRERGAMWDVGPHAVAQLSAVLGTVTGVLARRGRGDLASLLLEHESGAQGSVTLAADLPAPAPRGTATYFVGSHGRAEQPALTDWNASAREAYAAAIAHLADELEHGARPHACDIRFGAHVTAVLVAADRSAVSGRTETP